MLKSQEKNILSDTDSEVKIDFDALERELDNSDWSRGWEQGRIDALKAMQNNFLPRNDLVLRSAEIITKIMIAHFGNVFSRVFAGFNGHYDDFVTSTRNGTRFCSEKRGCSFTPNQITSPREHLALSFMHRRTAGSS